MKIAIANLGHIVSGDWRNPFVAGDTIVTDGDRLAAVGAVAAKDIESADVVIDAGGMTAIPGLIDSHVHITFGDYTPRQRTVGYLESYLHGGITTVDLGFRSACARPPARSRRRQGAGVAAQRCFASYRPGGMRVIAGSVILEPGLTAADFTELAGKGVGSPKPALVRSRPPTITCRWSRREKRRPDHHLPHRRLIDTGLWRDHRRSSVEMHPHVSFHINGGPTAMPDRDFERVIRESEIALQVCTAGNLRTALLCARLADRTRRFRPLHHRDRTPTGSGVMPLGMLYTMAHLASLTAMTPEQSICAATATMRASTASIPAMLKPATAADIVLIDAPDGGTQKTALAAIKHGDIAAIGAVVTAGVPRFVGRSRNTPRH